MKQLHYLFTGILGLFGMGLANSGSSQTVQAYIDVSTDQWGYEVYWQLLPAANNCGNSPIFTGGNTAVGCGGGGAQAQTPGGYPNNSLITEGPFTLQIGQQYKIWYEDDWGDAGSTFTVRVNCSQIHYWAPTTPFANGGSTFTAQQSYSDDVGIKEAYFYPLQTVPPALVDSSYNFYYSQTPLKQAINDTLWFNARVDNFGSNAANNVKLYIDVTGAGSYSDSSAAYSITSCTNDYLEITNSYFTPTALGIHNIDLRAGMAGDQNAANDGLAPGVPGLSTFEVTDSVYARDNDNPSGVWWYGAGNDYRIGNVFEIKVADTATSLSYYVPNPQTPNTGSVIRLAIWDASQANVVELAATDYYVLAAGDMGSWIHLPFVSGGILDANNNAVLTPGWYLIGLETQGQATYFSLSGGAPASAPLTVLVDPQLAGTWFYNTQGYPLMRMNFDKLCQTFSASATMDNMDSGSCDGQASATASGTPPYTYNWSSGGTNATEGGLCGGIYTVTITDANGCSAVRTVQIIVSGIDQHSGNGTLAMYPNPNSGQFTLALTGTGSYTLEVANVLGQAVHSQSVTVAGRLSKVMDLSALGKGVYTVTLGNASGKLHTEKLIIE